MLKRLDSFFLFCGMLTSAIVFTVVAAAFLEMTRAYENQWSAFFAFLVMFVTYFYWLCRGLWYWGTRERRESKEKKCNTQ